MRDVGMMLPGNGAAPWRLLDTPAGYAGCRDAGKIAGEKSRRHFGRKRRRLLHQAIAAVRRHEESLVLSVIYFWNPDRAVFAVGVLWTAKPLSGCGPTSGTGALTRVTCQRIALRSLPSGTSASQITTGSRSSILSLLQVSAMILPTGSET